MPGIYGHGFLSNLNQILDPPMKRKIEELRTIIHYIEGLQTNKTAVYNFSVPHWLEESRKVLSDICELRIEERIDKKFPNGLRPYLYSRLNLAIAIDEISKEVTRLLERGRKLLRGFKRCSNDTDLVGSPGKEAYIKILHDVCDEKEARIIRVSGRPGVGKTAVVCKIHNHTLEERHKHSFVRVFWVTTPPNASLEDLQQEIGKEMSVDLSAATDDLGRARVLLDALMKKKGRQRVLLILDLWKDLALEEIGIPKPSRENGCKLMIICRTLLAGSSVVGEDGINEVKDHEIKGVSPDDAFNLFADEVGEGRFHSLPEESWRMLLEECDCLPLVITNLGKWLSTSLAANDISKAIKNTVASFEFPFGSLKENYDSLREETRGYFFYCALFPCETNQDLIIETEDLIRYWIWDGLMGDNEGGDLDMDTMLKQGKEILDEIKNAYLLQIVCKDESKKECIMLNKSVRDMAAHISSTQDTSHCYLIKVGNKNIPQLYGRSLEEVERASVMSDQLEELGRGTKYRKLSTLVVRNQHDHNQLFFPAHLFRDMPNVKVLDISGTYIESFPYTFSKLKNLLALRLRGCLNLTSLPDVSPFLELLFLDLSSTRIWNLPSDLKLLKKLRHLDISCTPMEHYPFPDGLLNDLTDLQELLMLSSYLWTGQESAEDLQRVTKLAHLEANFSDLEALSIFLDSAEPEFGARLSRFKFCIGKLYLNQKLGENTLAVLINDIDVSDIKLLTVPLPVDNSTLHLMFNQNLEFLQFQYNTTASLQHLTTINVSDCGGLVYLFQANMLQAMANLRKIVVKRCQNMETLIQDSASPYDEFSLGKLQELVLFQLDKLCYICMGKVKCESLESISVWNCDLLSWMPDVVNRENNPILLKGQLSRIIVFNKMYTKLAEAKAPLELYSRPTYTDLSDRRPQEQRQSVVTFMWLVWSCIVAFSSILRFFRRLQYVGFTSHAMWRRRS